MSFINYLFTDKLEYINYNDATTIEQFSNLNEIWRNNHSCDKNRLNIEFANNKLGLIQALYIGSINGDYCVLKTIKETYSKVSKPTQNLYRSNDNIGTADINIISELTNEDSDVYHVHMTNSEKLTTEKINELSIYWKNKYNKNLVAIINLYDIDNRCDIDDMRHSYLNELNKIFPTKFDCYSTKSVSIDDTCSIFSAFIAGYTFRQHGRSNKIAYIMFNDNIPSEIYDISLLCYSP